jgi:iron-sulfur cluster repair protein YtfE (RIC family)
MMAAAHRQKLGDLCIKNLFFSKVFRHLDFSFACGDAKWAKLQICYQF